MPDVFVLSLTTRSPSEARNKAGEPVFLQLLVEIADQDLSAKLIYLPGRRPDLQAEQPDTRIFRQTQHLP